MTTPPVEPQPMIDRRRMSGSGDGIGRRVCLLSVVSGLFFGGLPGDSADNWAPKRCEILPLPDNQVAFQASGKEMLRWHFGEQYPRPFFFPLNGPSGVSLTRMGHPGAPNHDHHRSIWFAHHDVNGEGFWGDQEQSRIRQKSWYAYHDGDNESVMGSNLVWYGKDGSGVMDQDLVAAMIPLTGGEYALELQVTFRPMKPAATVQLGKTNFGFLAVRVAKSISAYFGGGSIRDSEGRQGEPEIFGQAARWMDYSGPVALGTGVDRTVVQEGITFFDHPTNPRYPTPWHVREDGWMGASFCLQDKYVIRQDAPLQLRYLLHVHQGSYDQARAETVHQSFASRPGFQIGKGTRKHNQFEIHRCSRNTPCAVKQSSQTVCHRNAAPSQHTHSSGVPKSSSHSSSPTST